MKTARQILLEAAKLLRKPGAWTKRNYARSFTGPVMPESDLATSFCAVGALTKVSGCRTSVIEGHNVSHTSNEDEAQKAGRLLREVIQERISDWNDKQESVKPIVAALRKAAKLAE